MMRLNNIPAALLLIMVIFSCNSTKITSSWKAENTDTRSLFDIMVWGILPEKDSTMREQMETHHVNDLNRKGYHAFSSLDVYKSKAYKKLSSKEIIDEFKASGVDAVITLVLLNKEEESKYYPPAVINQPQSTYGNLDKYYSTVYEKIFTPGYYIKTTNYYWEANLFDISTDKLVYSVSTKSFDPSNTEQLAHENGLKIMKDMLKKKVILDHNNKED